MTSCSWSPTCESLLAIPIFGQDENTYGRFPGGGSTYLFVWEATVALAQLEAQFDALSQSRDFQEGLNAAAAGGLSTKAIKAHPLSQHG
jgi:hypothetical protein